MEKKYDIFISYRREGGLEHARNVVLALNIRECFLRKYLQR